MLLTRRAVLLSSMAAGVMSGSVVAGTDALADALDLGYRAGLLNGLHAVHLTRGGERVFERYFTGRDESWGTDLGEVNFTAETLHDLRSVTKSVVSLLYGIALDRGLVPPPEAPLLDAFPDYADLADDPARAGWTIAHALNMQLGTEWNEALPYDDPANAEIAMENAPDRLRFVLNRPIVATPGTVWNYNGGATTLVGEIIARGAGQPLQRFAEDALFQPLGIDTWFWSGRSENEVAAASGLRLTAPDLARIGLMILQGGSWRGNRIVSDTWLDRLGAPKAQTAFGLAYSDGWYLSQQFTDDRSAPFATISASGNGGQRLFLIPELDLTLVVFAGSYNRMDDWMTPTLVLQRIVMANL